MQRSKALRTRGTPEISPEARAALDRLKEARNAREFIDRIFAFVPKLLSVHLTAFGYRPIGYRPTTVIHSNGERFTAAGAPSLVVDNPAEQYVEGSPRMLVGRTSEYLPKAPALYRTPFYQQVMKPGGWRYGMNWAFWEAEPGSTDLTAFVCAVRTTRQGDFSVAERALFESVHGEIEVVLRRVVESEVLGEVIRGLRSTLRKLPVPVLVIGAGDEVIAMNASAEGELRGWPGASESTGEIPTSVLRACAAVRAGGPEADRTVSGPGDRLARSRWLEGSEGGLIRVEFANREREAGGGTPLSELDRKLVGWLLTGRTDREIADLSGESLARVKADLRAIYARHQVRSRAELLAAVL